MFMGEGIVLKHPVLLLFRKSKTYPSSRREIRSSVKLMKLFTENDLELNDLYSSPNIVRVIKSRRMRWAGHVARMGEERGRIESWWGYRRERDHWGDLGVDEWIILGMISSRWDVGIWTGLGWPRIGTGGGRL